MKEGDPSWKLSWQKQHKKNNEITQMLICACKNQWICIFNYQQASKLQVFSIMHLQTPVCFNVLSMQNQKNIQCFFFFGSWTCKFIDFYKLKSRFLWFHVFFVFQESFQLGSPSLFLASQPARLSASHQLSRAWDLRSNELHIPVVDRRSLVYTKYLNHCFANHAKTQPPWVTSLIYIYIYINI